jgi:hypothetical protein
MIDEIFAAWRIFASLREPCITLPGKFPINTVSEVKTIIDPVTGNPF